MEMLNSEIFFLSIIELMGELFELSPLSILITATAPKLGVAWCRQIGGMVMQC